MYGEFCAKKAINKFSFYSPTIYGAFLEVNKQEIEGKTTS